MTEPGPDFVLLHGAERPPAANPSNNGGGHRVKGRPALAAEVQYHGKKGYRGPKGADDAPRKSFSRGGVLRGIGMGHASNPTHEAGSEPDHGYAKYQGVTGTNGKWRRRGGPG